MRFVFSVVLIGLSVGQVDAQIFPCRGTNNSPQTHVLPGTSGGCANGQCGVPVVQTPFISPSMTNFGPKPGEWHGAPATATLQNPVGHTHTCANGHTWDHTMDNGTHRCPTCGTSQFVVDPVPKMVLKQTPITAAKTQSLPSVCPCELPTIKPVGF